MEQSLSDIEDDKRAQRNLARLKKHLAGKAGTPIPPPVIEVVQPPPPPPAPVNTWESPATASYSEEPKYDGWADIPADWPEEINRLDEAWPPPNVPPDRWQSFVRQAKALLASRWHAEAKVLGWTERDLFGIDPRNPARIDRHGLIWHLHNNGLGCLGWDYATLEAPDGTVWTLPKISSGPNMAHVVPAWRLWRR